MHSPNAVSMLAQRWPNIETASEECLLFAGNADLLSQKVVSSYFTSKQILPFGLAEQNETLSQ